MTDDTTPAPPARQLRIHQFLAANKRCYDRLGDDSAISTVQRAKRKGTMREAFPSLPFGSPTCDRRECRDKDDTSPTTTTTISASPKSQHLNSAISSIPATTIRDAADAAAPSRGASVSPTPQHQTQLQLATAATTTTTTTSRQSTSSPSSSSALQQQQSQSLLLSPASGFIGGLPGTSYSSTSITSSVSLSATVRNDEVQTADSTIEGKVRFNIIFNSIVFN